MTAMRAALTALLLCSCSTVGEYYHERAWTTSGLPRAVVDEQASEVIFNSADPILVSSGPTYRRELTQVVQSAMQGGDQPARFRLRASMHVQKYYFFFFPCLIVLPLAGCPVAQEVADVDLDLEVGGRRYKGQAQETVWQGYYYNYDGVRAAVARATGKALEQISAKAGGQ